MTPATAKPLHHQRPWSTQEDSIIRTAIAQDFDPDRIQAILSRHADRRNLSQRDRQEILGRIADLGYVVNESVIPGGYISVPDLAEGLGTHIDRVLGWIQDKDFQKLLKPRRFEANWGIPYRGLQRFVRRYPGEVAKACTRDMDLVWFITLLTSPVNSGDI